MNTLFSIFKTVVLFTALSLCTVFFVMQPVFFTTVVLGLVGLWVLSYHLEIGLYIMIALSLMTEWYMSMSFDQYPDFLSQYETLLELYAPVVDFWALFLILAFVWFLCREWLNGRRPTINLPAIGLWGLFVLSALVSTLSVAAVEVPMTLKYILRYMVFLYIGYVILGVTIIKEKRILRHALQVLAGVGIAAALMGLLSLGLGLWQSGGFTRVVPFDIAGWAPFGYQHILLAEVLIVAFPITCFFFVTEKKQQTRLFWALAALVIGIVTMLTLSRAAWVTLAAATVLFGYLMKDEIPWRRLKAPLTLGGIVVGAFASYFLLFAFFDPNVSSSTAARVWLTEIALELFYQHPIIGSGAGTFVSRLAEVQIFAIEFGAPLEAHGIFQKILAEQGLFGIVTFSVFILTVAIALLKRFFHVGYSKEARSYALLGVFLVLNPVLFQVFNTQYYSSKMWIPIMLALAILSVFRWDKKQKLFFRTKEDPVIMTKV